MDEIPKRLDAIILVVLEFLRDHHALENNKIFIKYVLHIFNDVVFGMIAAKHIQFIVFYICSLSDTYA